MQVGGGACDHEVEALSCQFTAFSQQRVEVSSFSRLAGSQPHPARKLACPP
jgi:hypothetical protein